MDKRLRTYLVELTGTFFLVLLIGATACVAQLNDPTQPSVGLVGIAVAQGCVVAVLLTVTTLVSDGCLNPAIAIMHWVTKRFEGRQLLATLLVQLIGAAAGGLVVLQIFNQTTLVRAYAGTPHLLAFRVGDGAVPFEQILLGVLVEAALTAVVTLAIYATLFDPRRPKLGGLFAGLAVTAAVLAGYHLTGAALNPARWFGTAVWQMNVPTLSAQPVFADHPVYWMGPILGAMLAGIIYTGLILPDEEKTKEPHAS